MRLVLSLVILAIGTPALAEPVEIWGYRPAALYAKSVGAQAPIGWYAGFGLGGTAVVRQVGGPEQLGGGGGGHLFAGLHIHPRAALEIGWSESFHNPAQVESTFGTTDYLVLDGISVGARAYLAGVEPSWSPYLMLGLGAYGLGSQWFGPEASGTGFHLGLGVDAWLGDILALDLRLRYRGISMESVDDQFSNSYISILGFELGISFHL